MGFYEGFVISENSMNQINTFLERNAKNDVMIFVKRKQTRVA
jgi:hypothetical protein